MYICMPYSYFVVTNSLLKLKDEWILKAFKILFFFFSIDQQIKISNIALLISILSFTYNIHGGISLLCVLQWNSFLAGMKCR